jgi:hypothetical protein
MYYHSLGESKNLNIVYINKTRVEQYKYDITNIINKLADFESADKDELFDEFKRFIDDGDDYDPYFLFSFNDNRTELIAQQYRSARFNVGGNIINFTLNDHIISYKKIDLLEY